MQDVSDLHNYGADTVRCSFKIGYFFNDLNWLWAQARPQNSDNISFSASLIYFDTSNKHRMNSISKYFYLKQHNNYFVMTILTSQMKCSLVVVVLNIKL